MRPLRRAAILAVGSELLMPFRVDTNSLRVTERLNAVGIEVVVKLIVGDDRAELGAAFRAARSRADLIVVTGGLGPTDDDVTREVIAGVLGRQLSEDVSITEQLRARFAARFISPMPEINRRQAMVPEGALVIANTRGSAPGLWMEDDSGIVVLLPGPPRELLPMLDVLDGRLRERGAGAVVARRVIKITGRVESSTDEALQPLYREWERASPPIAATILAALGQIEVHLTTCAETIASGQAVLDAAVSQAVGVLDADVFSTDGRSLEEVVGDLLVARGLHIALAESCTGGLITSRLTDVAGSSRYVRHSVIAYSNDAKTGLLGVPTELIEEHGAVSEQVALGMADGIRSHAGVDVGVGVTGIAGPGGGSVEKPVGTVAIATVTAAEARSRLFRFNGEREQVKFQSAQAALDMVRRMLTP